MRSLATLKNSMWGILQQIIVCILSLFSRRVMIDTIGVEGVGLNALLTSVITMLSLAELGIGTAIVYHMYAPIAANDQKQIARLMHTYRNIYRIIAAVIFLLGLCLLPFMHRIVSDTDYSARYIRIIFVLFLLQTTSSYLFTYKRSMLSADQKQYIITIFDLCYKIFTILAGIAVLMLTRELACYLLLLIVSTVVENLLISRKVDRMYPYLKEHRASLPKEENIAIAKDVKNIFIGKVSGVITTSTDSILINAFVGTVQTGLYSNYNIILGTLTATLKQLASAMRGSGGDLALTTLVHTIRAHIESSDVLVRYGGDEFVLILLEISEDHFEDRLSKIQNEVYRARVEGYRGLQISVSIGGVLAEDETVEEAVARADKLMYLAKSKKIWLSPREPCCRKMEISPAARCSLRCGSRF